MNKEERIKYLNQQKAVFLNCLEIAKENQLKFERWIKDIDNQLKIVQERSVD